MIDAFAWFFLSLRGRISRQEYWLGYVGLIVLYIALNGLLAPLFLDWLRPVGRLWYRHELDLALAMPKVWLAIAFTWPMATLYVKRLHDMNLSGWWLAAMPFISLLASTLNAQPWHFAFLACLIGLGLMPGTRGDNRFGADPVLRAA